MKRIRRRIDFIFYERLYETKWFKINNSILMFALTSIWVTFDALFLVFSAAHSTDCFPSVSTNWLPLTSLSTSLNCRTVLLSSCWRFLGFRDQVFWIGSLNPSKLFKLFTRCGCDCGALLGQVPVFCTMLAVLTVRIIASLTEMNQNWLVQVLNIRE